MTWTRLIPVLGAAVALALTGCNSECTDSFDCRGRGTDFICSDGRCVQESPREDAGTPDAGMADAGASDAGPMDAGMDAGGMDAGADAGMDAGVECGGAICPPGTSCITADGAPRCEGWWIGATSGTTGASKATLLYPADGGGLVSLGEGSTRWPRFSGTGLQVAFVRETPSGDELWVWAPGADGGGTRVTASDAGIVDLEFAPADDLVWAKKVDTSTSGIYWAPPTEGAIVSEVLDNGRHPDWMPGGGGVLAYSNFLGVNSVTRDGATNTPLTSGGTAPLYNASGSHLAFLRSAGTDPGFDEELWTVNTSGAPIETRVAAATSTAVPTDGGLPPVVGMFIAYPTWSPTSNLLSYVEVRYVGATKAFCTAATCGGEQARTVVLVDIDPATGAPKGPPMRVSAGPTLPALSPDDLFIAYVQGGSVLVQPLGPGGTPDAGPPVSYPVTGGVLTNDDHRPRWQSK